jgi:hypothetical protein
LSVVPPTARIAHRIARLREFFARRYGQIKPPAQLLYF